MVETNEDIIAITGLLTQFGSKTVHKNLDLSVKRGEILALMGGSGAGKSTLLRALIGLEAPQSGQCKYNDKDIFILDESSLTEVRKQIAYAFQGGALFDSLTVGENLQYPLLEHTEMSEEEREEAVSSMLEKIRLPDIQDQMPASLSGGMQKRVGLARALMLNPEVILYDEPTAGLDPANTKAIADIIIQLRDEGKTGILVTHDVPCALRIADRFAFIADGHIAALQTREEFHKNPDPILDAYIKGETL